MAKFSSGQAISFGWEATKRNVGFLAPFIFVFWLVVFILDKLAVSGGGAILVLLAALVEICFGVVMVKIALRLVDGETVNWSTAFQGVTAGMLGNFIWTIILFMIPTVIGYFFLAIPGIIIGLGLGQCVYLVIDKGVSGFAALARSWEITRGSKLDLFGFQILAGLVIILGAICFGVGIIVALPTVAVASAYVYRTLEGGLQTPVTSTTPPAQTPPVLTVTPDA